MASCSCTLVAWVVEVVKLAKVICPFKTFRHIFSRVHRDSFFYDTPLNRACPSLQRSRMRPRDFADATSAVPAWATQLPSRSEINLPYRVAVPRAARDALVCAQAQSVCVVSNEGHLSRRLAGSTSVMGVAGVWDCLFSYRMHNGMPPPKPCCMSLETRGVSCG